MCEGAGIDHRDGSQVVSLDKGGAVKLGVITDGIDRDLERALPVMKDHGLEYAELQYIKEKTVEDLSDTEVNQVRKLLDDQGIKVSCISTYVFRSGSVRDIDPNSRSYKADLEVLKRAIEIAHALGTSIIRVFSFSKDMVLFGERGAETWVVAKDAWKRYVELMHLPARIAEDAGVTLAVETGNGGMINSAYLGRKLVNELDSEGVKILWDPCNCLYCGEPPYPQGYMYLRDGALAHIHMKDAIVEPWRATINFTALGEGHMASSLKPLAYALADDGYRGVISLESVYRPTGGTFADGFRASVPSLQRLFYMP